MQHLLGELYFRAKNRPKALGFFVGALGGMVAERKQLDQVYEVFKRGMECCGSIREKKACHRQMVGKLTAASFSEQQECLSINTHTCCLICEGFNDEERDNLIIFLEYHQGTAPHKLHEWGWLEAILRKVGRSEHTSA